MPIQFEEVSATVTPPEPPSSSAQSAAPKPAEDGFQAQMERALRLMEERAARLGAD